MILLYSERQNFRYNLLREKFFRAILFRIYLGTDTYISPEIFSCSPTLVFVAQNFLATNTHVSGLLEKISGNISVPSRLW
jgi:hypothetical protein